MHVHSLIEQELSYLWLWAALKAAVCTQKGFLVSYPIYRFLLNRMQPPGYARVTHTLELLPGATYPANNSQHRPCESTQHHC